MLCANILHPQNAMQIKLKQIIITVTSLKRPLLIVILLTMANNSSLYVCRANDISKIFIGN